MTVDLEEGTELTLDFDKLQAAASQSVVPCAVQDADSREVILVAYVNREALEKSISTRSAVFWSTSRGEFWEKGKTSGDTFDLVEIRVNCEQNSLLYVVRRRRNGICHTTNGEGIARDCFYRRLDLDSGPHQARSVAAMMKGGSGRPLHASNRSSPGRLSGSRQPPRPARHLEDAAMVDGGGRFGAGDPKLAMPRSRS